MCADICAFRLICHYTFLVHAFLGENIEMKHRKMNVLPQILCLIGSLCKIRKKLLFVNAEMLTLLEIYLLRDGGL